MGEAFFSLYRKGGFSKTLSILSEFDKYEAKESRFFSKLQKKGYYLNDFYRVKDDLLEYGVISYRLDKNYEKVLYLTKKGSELYNLLQEIEELLNP